MFASWPQALVTADEELEAGAAQVGVEVGPLATCKSGAVASSSPSSQSFRETTKAACGTIAARNRGPYLWNLFTALIKSWALQCHSLLLCANPIVVKPKNVVCPM